MWAQLISMTLKPGSAEQLPGMLEKLRSFEQADSGLLRTTAFVDQKDPTRAHLLVVFESEEKATEREQDPRRQEGLQELLPLMAEVMDGPREFADLNVLYDAAR